MMDLQQFASAFGIDPTNARDALDRKRETSDAAAPWFVQGLLALGSWIAALVIIAFGGVLLIVVFELDADSTFGMVLGIMGLGVFALGFLILKSSTEGIFANQFGTAIAAAGQAMVAIGTGMYFDSVVAAAVVSIPFCVLVATHANSRALQTLSSASTVVLALLALGDLQFEFPLEITALGVVAGAYLTLRPPLRDLTPTALVLLMTGPLAAIMAGFLNEFGVAYSFFLAGWGARAVYGALSAYLFYTLWRQARDQPTRIRIALFALAAVVLSVMLPPGGSAAITIIVLAFVLGSHLLAVLGIGLQIYALSKFYYDLDITLLTKSMILVGAGIIMLALWAVMIRTQPKEQRL